MLTVTVYTAGPGCVQCRLTRQCLTRAGIAFTEIDLTDEVNGPHRDYVTEELGYSQAPVVMVDDEPEHHWSGFQPALIARLAEQVVRPTRIYASESPRRGVSR